MKNRSQYLAIIGLCIALAGSVPGCGTPFQGIRLRAQAPAIEEAYRNLSIAVTLDEYRVARTDPKAFALESEWRALKKNEASPQDTTGGDAVPEVRVTLKLVQRGALYDVLLTPWLRTQTMGKESISVAPPTHPLRIKWEKTIARLIEREARDED